MHGEPCCFLLGCIFVMGFVTNSRPFLRVGCFLGACFGLVFGFGASFFFGFGLGEADKCGF